MFGGNRRINIYYRILERFCKVEITTIQIFPCNSLSCYNKCDRHDITDIFFQNGFDVHYHNNYYYVVKASHVLLLVIQPRSEEKSR